MNIFAELIKRNKDAIKLIKEVKDINQKDDDDTNTNILHQALVFQNQEVCKYVIKKGIDVNLQDENLQTPLHYACSRKNSEIVDLILKNKGDLTICDKYGNTPLWYVINDDKVSIEIIKLFRNSNPEDFFKVVNLKNKFGKSPLSVAKNMPKVLKLLKEEK